MVEWKKLGEIAKISIGEFVHKDKQSPHAAYPVYNGGISYTGFYDNYNNTENKIVISARGATAGFVNRVFCKYWAGNSSYSIDVNQSIASWSYIYYYLKNLQFKLILDQQKGGGIPSISKKQVQDISVPVPSLSEQQRVVGILDTFTASIDNLKEQIAQRRKQYEYYRDQLLDLEGKEGVEMKVLGDVCKLERGVRVVKKELKEDGIIPVYQNSLTPLGYFEKSNYPENTPFVICAGAAGEIGFSKKLFWAADDCTCVVYPSSLNGKYIYHCLKIKQSSLKSQVRKASVPRLSKDVIGKLIVPIPSLSEQQRIVSILDTFEASIRNLEAQLAQREKQYEYYRNKLLTFE